MKYTTADRFAQKLSRATLVAGMAAAVVAVPLATMGGSYTASAATSAGGDATISVNVRAISVDIIQVNGFEFSGDQQSNSVAVKTYTAQNNIHFRTDYDAHVKIILDGTVLWEGDTKADQPAVADIDLGDRPVGTYRFTVRAAFTDNPDSYSESYFWLDYQPTVPSIINAPNTGMYVKIGGRMYSMSTIALVLLLSAIIVFLLCTRHRDEEMAKAKVRAKANRKGKKADLI